jgi:hypothetical protein
VRRPPLGRPLVDPDGQVSASWLGYEVLRICHVMASISVL